MSRYHICRNIDSTANSTNFLSHSFQFFQTQESAHGWPFFFTSSTYVMIVYTEFTWNYHILCKHQSINQKIKKKGGGHVLHVSSYWDVFHVHDVVRWSTDTCNTSVDIWQRLMSNELCKILNLTINWCKFLY